MTLKFDIRGSRTLGALWLWARRADKRHNGRAAGCIDLKFDIRGSHTRENVKDAITGKELTYQQIVQHTDCVGGQATPSRRADKRPPHVGFHTCISRSAPKSHTPSAAAISIYTHQHAPPQNNNPIQLGLGKSCSIPSTA